MSFQIKDFRSIAASMVNVARASQSKVTDFSVGSVARTLMESPAIEIEELYLQMWLGLQDAIPVAIYKAFDFDISEALPAAGVLSISFPESESALFIPRGTVFEAQEKSLVFKSLEAVPIALGATQAQISIYCTTPGIVGNISVNAISAVSSASLFPGGSVFSNLTFVSGKDAESEVERKSRFTSFILSVSRGTIDSIRYCSGLAKVNDVTGLVQEFVTRVGIDERQGRVGVYISGSAGLPSLSLLAKVQENIDGYLDPATGRRVNGYRPAGVAVTALAMQERVINVSLSVSTKTQAQNNSDLASAITGVVARIVSGISPGSSLRAEAITSGILALAGVMSCDLINNENVICGQFERLLPGSTTVAWVPYA